ncbi:hypothetical protein NL441_22200, partial [Klebsiella pneumoniae]|nr:hypothetical protein [Klebsiella pneumoniae]
GMVCVVGRMRDLILQLSKSSIYSTKPHQTIRGRIECRWRRYKKGIELLIKVPFNLKKCTLKLPKVYQLNKQLPAPIDCDTYHHFYDITDAGEIKVLL